MTTSAVEIVEETGFAKIEWYVGLAVIGRSPFEINTKTIDLDPSEYEVMTFADFEAENKPLTRLA